MIDSLPVIDYGTVSFETGEVAANGVTTKAVTFNKTFTEAPIVVLTLSIATSLTYYGNTEVAASGRKTAGFDVRIVNNSSYSELSPTYCWIAIGT